RDRAQAHAGLAARDGDLDRHRGPRRADAPARRDRDPRARARDFLPVGRPRRTNAGADPLAHPIAMTVVKDLLTAIDADPEDEAPQLVIADLLIAEGDPRGELIVLDHRERTGQLDERDGLE